MTSINTDTLEGTIEHGYVKMSRKRFEAIMQYDTLSGYTLNIDWGKPDEQGFYAPKVTYSSDEYSFTLEDQ